MVEGRMSTGTIVESPAYSAYDHPFHRTRPSLKIGFITQPCFGPCESIYLYIYNC